MTVSRVPNVEGGIQPTIVTAKGDLITAVANANPARLGVGSDGQELRADSTAATGLSWANDFSAGKNKIINGDFRINQRGFTSTTTVSSIGFDRFGFYYGGGTVTYSAQTFTPGTAPVAGYEAINFARVVSASQSAAGDYSVFFQRIEDVRTLAPGDYTISFWAKAGSGTPKIGVSVLQNFGSGGSSTVYTASSAPTITTSWVRYSFTLTIPSVSGKTIGTSSFCEIAITMSAGATIVALGYPNVGVQNATFDIWGVQVEQGSTATAFQTATGTIQGELAACRRYLPAFSGDVTYLGHTATTNFSIFNIPFDVPARVAPTGITASGNIYAYAINTSSAALTPSFWVAGTTAANVSTGNTATAGNVARLQIASGALILFTGCEL